MKRYVKESVLVLVQVLLFYAFPFCAGPTDAMGMVFILLAATLFLSLLMGILSDSRMKYLYAIAVSLLFIPSVFIHYNASAFIHALWYFVVSSVGLAVGAVIHKLVYRRK